MIHDKIFLKHNRHVNGSLIAEDFSSNMPVEINSKFLTEGGKNFLGIDLLSEYHLIISQRKICSDYPREINRHLVHRYNKEFALPLGAEKFLSREDAERVLVSFILVRVLNNQPFIPNGGSTFNFIRSPDDEDIVLLGPRTKVNYEDNVRVIRNEIIKLTGAIPHEEDDLYLVY